MYYSWTIWAIPKTHNWLRNKHWGQKAAETKRWKRWVNVVCGPPPFNTLTELKKVNLTIRVYRAKRQDKDNRYASVKSVVDAIKKAGWLYDDSPKWVELKAEEYVERRKSYQRTEIEWKMGGM